MRGVEGGERGVVGLEDAEGEGEAPEEGFEDVGREEEAVGKGAAVGWGKEGCGCWGGRELGVEG